MAISKSAIIDGIAEKTGVTKQTAEAMLECLAQLAYANAKDEFTVPGITDRRPDDDVVMPSDVN